MKGTEAGVGERRAKGTHSPPGRRPEHAEARPDEPACFAPAAACTGLAGLFGAGPFARLDGFGDAVVRERSPWPDAPDFAPDAG